MGALRTEPLDSLIFRRIPYTFRRISVKNRNLTAPPGAPSEGDRYIVAVGGTGAWSGKDNQLTEWHVVGSAAAAWIFEDPWRGYRTYVEDEATDYEWDGTAWIQLPSKSYVDSKVAGLNWQEPVLDRDLSAPPTPITGRYIVKSPGSGAWAGHDNDIVDGDTGSWVFTAEGEGMCCYVDDENIFVYFDGTNWIKLSSGIGSVTQEKVDPDATEAQTLDTPINHLKNNLNRIRWHIVQITGEAWETVSHSIAEIWAKFHATTGHKHTGGADDSPQLAAADTHGSPSVDTHHAEKHGTDKHTDLEYDSASSSGLSFYYKAGRIRSDNSVVDVSAGFVVLADDDVNYVEVDGAGIVTDNIVGFTAGKIPLYEVTTASGAITLATDKRTWQFISGAGGYTNLTQFVNQTAWRVFYSNADGDVIELALGADGTYLKSNGAAVAPTFSTPAGAGDVVGPGSAVDERITVFDGITGKLIKDGGKKVADLIAVPAGSAQGDILIRGAAGWIRLAAGTSGFYLKTQGVAADPMWDSPAGAGNVVGPGSAVDERLAAFDGVTGKLIKDSGKAMADVHSELHDTEDHTNFAYDSAASSGLNFYYKAGRVRNDNVITNVSASFVLLADDDVNYVEVAGDGTVSDNITGFTAGKIPLYEVTTASGSISVVTDKRTWLNLGGGAGGGFTDRGDPVTWDKLTGDFTTDGEWHDLDLSAIVPAGAIAIELKIYLIDDAKSRLSLRKKGNSNESNGFYLSIPIINQDSFFYGMVSCDSNRVIEYKATNTTFGGIYIVVRGWFK